MRPVDRAQPFERRDVGAIELPTGVTHERNRRAVDDDGAGAALRQPQPNFGPRSARSSLSTYSSGVAGSTSCVALRPFTVNVT